MANPIITINVDRGKSITAELFVDRFPETANLFLGTFERGFYNALSFHTCVKDEYIQFGYHDNNGYGVYAADLDDVSEDDTNEEVIPHEEGHLAVITAKYPHLSKYQLAIIFTDKPILSFGREISFKPIGRVIDGLEYAREISRVEVDDMLYPILPVVIKNVDVKKD